VCVCVVVCVCVWLGVCVWMCIFSFYKQYIRQKYALYNERKNNTELRIDNAIIL